MALNSVSGGDCLRVGRLFLSHHFTGAALLYFYTANYYPKQGEILKSDWENPSAGVHGSEE